MPSPNAPLAQGYPGGFPPFRKCPKGTGNGQLAAWEPSIEKTGPLVDVDITFDRPSRPATMRQTPRSARRPREARQEK